MTKIQDLKGYSYPISPEGKSSVVGDFPWHYGTEYLVIAYRTDPDEIAKWLPKPLEPGIEADVAYVAFSKWWSVWDDMKDMPSIMPERTQYKEGAIWVGCSYQGTPGQMCLPIWVDNDFSMARGWFMGFPKKLGQVQITDYNPLNPAMGEVGIGSKFTGIVSSHGEKLIRGSLKIDRKITRAELPKPLGLPLFHIRHFPSIVAGAKPSVLELVSLGSENWTWDENIWAGTGELEFFPSEIEEHMPLAPKEIIGAYRFRNGYTFAGGKVLHDWLKDE
ncbi:MAG: acetoacetate decarboxylase family protein [Clostridiaceae bacterium]